MNETNSSRMDYKFRVSGLRGSGSPKLRNCRTGRARNDIEHSDSLRFRILLAYYARKRTHLCAGSLEP